ncbi:zinc ribbon domain-containing protein [Halogeometricum sp. S1BR25-6]|uniref:Zinc ribbon domain-containing protein n=1 Tax=Halogeometricum salsisoli TaxID=2950536 RepID=A0ABU2GBC5_9EURY|nr:zinc ribbon domain-containing protein [Halogeometricum sp. S1BR25-6]MDS0298107.1 zinc ribbon domain-containing protein [Halogeometricum sp. S1BR25-6]
MADTRRRAMVAAFVGVLGASVGIAGAGHVYLREWRRAASWFAFVVGAGLVLLSVFADPTAVTFATLDQVPSEVTGPLFVLLFLSTFDAYYVAGRDARDETGPRCPACGGELDPEVRFCPWCATELERRPAVDPDPTPVDASPDGESGRSERE